MKTIAIVGAGPGLGLSLAKTFGQHRFRVALLARTQEKLDTYVQQLQEMSIEAAGFAANVSKAAELEAAFARIKETFGPVDVLEYSPTPSEGRASALEVTAEKAEQQFHSYVSGAITCVNAVLPDMLARESGALLFTAGLSAVVPMPILGTVGIAMAGLRNYVLNLNQVLAPSGIYAAMLAIGIFMAKGDPEKDPDIVAAYIYEMYEQREYAEKTFPHGLTAIPAETTEQFHKL
jgi:NAD(P)-dependent dehydrogenase (short-subunit alcohol dehydrogenase family)